MPHGSPSAGGDQLWMDDERPYLDRSADDGHRLAMDPASAYREHVAAVTDEIASILSRHGYDRLVIHSGALQPKSLFDDQDWPFSPLAFFAYLAPLSWPDCFVVFEPGRPTRLYALETGSFWERLPEPDWELLASALEVHRIDDIDHVGAVGWHGRTVFIGNAPREGFMTPSMELNAPMIVDDLHELRTIKSAWEVDCISRASLRATRGHLAAARAFEEGNRSELAIHLAYLAATEQDDADCPYKNIVALGRNGATLHHVTYAHEPEAESMLIDAGARTNGYCSDITRTYAAPGDGDARARFANLIDAMERLQLRIIGQIEPGLAYEALHDRAHIELGQLLVESGLVTCTAESAVDQGITRVFLPHGLGHHLGIQVHDVAGLPREPRTENRFLRNTRTIAPGQVFTIEPGLYFIEPLLDVLKSDAAGRDVDWTEVSALVPFGGIRIEDDILVLPEGSDPRVRNLTREAFART